MFAQVRNRGDQDLRRQVRHRSGRRRLPQHRARAVGDGLRRMREAVLVRAANREERAAGARGTPVLRQVGHRDVGRELGEPVEQARQAVRRRSSHRVATWRVSGSVESLTGASGGTASRRNAPPTTPENTGAATSPP
jgi:hypothetical protein